MCPTAVISHTGLSTLSMMNDAIRTAGHVYRQNAVNLHTAGRQMATLDVVKLLLLTNQTKLTLTVTLTLTDTVTVIFFTRISLTPIERLNRNLSLIHI